MKKLKIECQVSDETYARIKASIYFLRRRGQQESALYDILAQVESEKFDDVENDNDAVLWDKFRTFINQGMERRVQKEVREYEDLG